MADVIKSIGSGKDYATVNAWYVNWLNTGSAFAGDNEIGQVYGHVTESVITTFNTGNTTSTQYIILESAPGERHEGLWDDNKARISCGNAVDWEAEFKTLDTYMIIRDLQFHKGVVGTLPSFHTAYAFELRYSTNALRRNIIKYTSAATVARPRGVNLSGPGEVSRNVIYGFVSETATRGRGIDMSVEAAANIFQNTISGCNDGFHNDGNGAPIVYQNYCGGNIDNDYGDAATIVDTSKNISSDATSPDGASYRGFNSYTDYFVDYANKDFHVKAGNTALNLGDDLGSPYDYDIDNIEVFSTIWDVGASQWSDYTKGDYDSLPGDDTNLENIYTKQDYIDVATEDTDRVLQCATSDFTIHQYKNRNDNSTDAFTVTWIGQSNVAPSTRTVYLQIYNRDTTTWDTLDSDSTTAADTDFTLTSVVGAARADYYGDANEIACRVYQYGSLSGFDLGFSAGFK